MPEAATLEKRGGAGKARLRWAAAAAFAGLLLLVLWGSLTPQPPSAPGRISDKIQHFSAYFALAGLAGLALSRRPRLVAVGLIGFGIAVEIGQALMALGRQGTVFDALANALGVAAALLLPRTRSILIRVVVIVRIVLRIAGVHGVGGVATAQEVVDGFGDDVELLGGCGQGQDPAAAVLDVQAVAVAGLTDGELGERLGVGHGETPRLAGVNARRPLPGPAG